MKSIDAQRLEEVFNEALELPADERPAFLAVACGEDEELRREVESLLDSHDERFLEEDVSGRVLELLRGGLAPGDVVGGRYKIEQLIGSGGMGEVYRAEDLTIKRKVALKALAEEFSQDKQRVKSFQHEAQTASRPNHPNILTVHDFIDVGEQSFIITEYIEGETLRAKLQAGPLDVPTALRISRQVASALEAAHASGVVHRDIKPENVIVKEDGHAKVLDFGIAKLAEREVSEGESDQSGLSRSDGAVVFGTANYMSPEQVRAQDVDPRTDIWSLGVCLYEMLAGAPPCKGQTRIDTFASMLKDEPAPLGPHVPESLKAVVRRALQKNRDSRYQTASELLFDLNNSSATSYEGANTFDEWRRTAGANISRRLLICVAASVLLSTVAAFAIYFSDPARSEESLKNAAKAAQAVGCIFHLIAIVIAFLYLRVHPGPQGFRSLNDDSAGARLKSHITYATGYEKIRDWRWARNIAKGTLRHYREAFIWLLFAWLFLYLWGLVSLLDHGGRNVIVATVYTLANNLNTLCIWLCYDILNEPITTGNRTQSQKGIVVTEGRRWPRGFIPVLFAMIFWLILEWWLTSNPGSQADTVHYISKVISGISGGVAMALFVGRFQSKFLKSPAWLVLILFLYTVIQALFIFYGGESSAEKGAAAAVMNVALLLKCLLILYMFWLFQSGRLLFYLVRVRRASKQVDSEWLNFREVLR